VLNRCNVQFLALLGFNDKVQKQIWIVGSSIVKHAFTHARKSLEGVNLGLGRCNARVWWQGKGGMRWAQLVPRVQYLLNFESPPEVLVIHCGGNSLGYVPLHTLRRQIFDAILEIRCLLPKTKIVWSQILPRKTWLCSSDSKALNLAASRIDNFAAYLCGRLKGGYIKYPEICWDEDGMFAGDGVHLSELGNNVFIHNMQNAMFEMLKHN